MVVTNRGVNTATVSDPEARVQTEATWRGLALAGFCLVAFWGGAPAASPAGL